MIIKIGQFDITECWDGIFYKKLSRYPCITDWEIQTVLDFERYERDNGRECPIEAEKGILRAIDDYRPVYEKGVRLSPPDRITECTACPVYGGCMTDLVCHTAAPENAVKILDCGRILSAVRARRLSAKELRSEKRNAANDPEDYFDYVMFAWGNCQAGDRLVVERRLGRFPKVEDLAAGFVPGVRFFFKYRDLVRHPRAVFDGFLPVKVKNEVVLRDWVTAIVSPGIHRGLLEPHIPEGLRTRTFFLGSAGKDVWEWSRAAYEFARDVSETK